MRWGHVCRRGTGRDNEADCLNQVTQKASTVALGGTVCPLAREASQR